MSIDGSAAEKPAGTLCSSELQSPKAHTMSIIAATPSATLRNWQTQREASATQTGMSSLRTRDQNEDMTATPTCSFERGFRALSAWWESNELFHTRATLAHFLAAQLSYALAWQRSLQKEPALNVCSGARTSRYQAPLAVASGIDCHCNCQRQACELSSPALLFFLTRPLLRSMRFPAAAASVALS